MNNNEKTFFIIMMSMAPFAMAQTSSQKETIRQRVIGSRSGLA